MLAGFKTIARLMTIFALVGALVGVLLGALTENYPLFVAIMAVFGAGFGMAIGYGLLPER